MLATGTSNSKKDSTSHTLSRQSNFLAQFNITAPGPSRKKSRSPIIAILPRCITLADGNTEDKELLISNLQISLAAFAESEIAFCSKGSDTESRRAEIMNKFKKF
ncbi:hypothetical protein Tco_0617132 [Tanacetum coccineum]